MGDMSGWTAREVCDCVVWVAEEAGDVETTEEMGSVVGREVGSCLMRVWTVGGRSVIAIESEDVEEVDVGGFCGGRGVGER